MILGFDIGGTKSAVVTAKISQDNIEITAKEKILTDLSVEPQVMIDRLIDIADKLRPGKRNL